MKSSNTKVLDIDEDGKVYLISEGKANIVDDNGVIFKIETLSYENFFKKLYEIAGELVLVVGDKIYDRDYFIAKYSLKTAPAMSFKLRKNSKIESIDKSKWQISVRSGSAKVAADGTITKAAGETEFDIKYVDKENNISIDNVSIKIRLVDVDTTKLNITSLGGESAEPNTYINVDTAKGREIITTKGNEVFFFYDDGNYYDIFDDVKVTVANKDIADTGEYSDQGLYAKKVGSTTVTLEGPSIKNGKQVIYLTVVDNIYQYKTEHPELFPSDFVVSAYDYHETADYEKMDEEKIKNADVLNATIYDNHVAKSSVFESLKKYKDKKLAITSINQVNNKYYYATWEFDSNTITDTSIDFNPAVVTSNKKFDNIENNEVSEGIFIDFSHSGKLPGKAKVSLNVPNELYEKYSSEEEKTLYVYYYNPNTKDYEYVTEAKCKGGSIQFEIEHCSQYYVSDTKLAGKKNKGELDDEPKTGSQSYIAIAGLVALVSIAGIVIAKR